MSERSGDGLNRVEKIKEALRLKHLAETESRLSQTPPEEGAEFSRFNKYRRSASEKHVSRTESSHLGDHASHLPQSLIPRRTNILASTYSNNSAQQKIISSPPPSLLKSKTEDLSSRLSPKIDKKSKKWNKVQELSSSFEGDFSNSSSSYARTHNEVSIESPPPPVLKKPAIPQILKKSPHLAPESSDVGINLNSIKKDEEEEGERRRRPNSILKKREESGQSGGGGTVSFDLEGRRSSLDKSPTLLRTKSSESNVSYDSETGYWSGGESLPSSGILKQSRESWASDGDQEKEMSGHCSRSILKDRRSSLGSSLPPQNHDSSSTSSSLPSILKRKHSYDSSSFTNSSFSNPSSHFSNSSSLANPSSFRNSSHFSNSSSFTNPSSYANSSHFSNPSSHFSNSSSFANPSSLANSSHFLSSDSNLAYSERNRSSKIVRQKPILKKKISGEEEEERKKRPILKKKSRESLRSSEEGLDFHEEKNGGIRPILKKLSSGSEGHLIGEETTFSLTGRTGRSILKRGSRTDSSAEELDRDYPLELERSQSERRPRRRVPSPPPLISPHSHKNNFYSEEKNYAQNYENLAKTSQNLPQNPDRDNFSQVHQNYAQNPVKEPHSPNQNSTKNPENRTHFTPVNENYSHASQNTAQNYEDYENYENYESCSSDLFQKYKPTSESKEFKSELKTKNTSPQKSPLLAKKLPKSVKIEDFQNSSSIETSVKISDNKFYEPCSSSTSSYNCDNFKNMSEIESRKEDDDLGSSVASKRSLFYQKELKEVSCEELKNNIMAHERKDLLGSLLGELSTRNTHKAQEKKSFEEVEMSSTTGIKNEKIDEFDEEPSKLSLSERVRLFNGLSSPPPPSFLNYKSSTKKNVTSRRFQTQPVTSAERLSAHDWFVGSGAKESTDSLLAHTGEEVKGEGGEELDCASSKQQQLKTELKMRSKVILNSSGEHSSSNDESDSSGHHSGSGSSEGLDLQHTSLVRKRLSKSSSFNICPISMEEEESRKSSKGSIADKIAALKTNGETNWRKRVTKTPLITSSDSQFIISPTDTIDEVDQNVNVDYRKNNQECASIVANRLSLLEKSQDGWRQRVSENDANLFTVQSKLEKAGKLANKTEKKSKILKFKTKNSTNNDERVMNLENVLKKGPKSPPLLLSSPASSPPKIQPQIPVSISPKPIDKICEEELVKRSVASNDNETFSNFFPSLPQLPSKIHTEISHDFDALKSEEREFLGLKKGVKIVRKNGGSRNPVRNLAARLQEQVYSEIKPEVREKEMKKRAQIESLSKTSHLSVDALAGLVSKEDFTAVKLKKAENIKSGSYPYPMLLRIKGKRFVQTRLVEPNVSSLSSGDCFILLTDDKIYEYIGEFSNRMEKNKLSDVVTHIVQKRDLGTRLSSPTEVISIEEPLHNLNRPSVAEFFKILKHNGGARVGGDEETLGDEADEDYTEILKFFRKRRLYRYETGVIRTNRVFEVDPSKDELVPVLDEGGWGTQPKFSMLQEERVLIFDFGSELYMWSGSRSLPSLKTTAYRLSRELNSAPYNFSEVGHEFSPLPPPSLDSPGRPSWTLFKKVTQHMESILFREKFSDWPDESGRRGWRGQRSSECGDGSRGQEWGWNFSPVQPSGIEELIEGLGDPELELELFNVGRGREVSDEKEKRHYVISTRSVTSWRMSESEAVEMSSASHSHFYSSETYVVRWEYGVMQVGRDLKGELSKHGGVLGRDRTAYFFWHGSRSKVTEQGTSALLTVELDKEKGPQIRVVEGKEPPAFLNLFSGKFVIYSGTPDEWSKKKVHMWVSMGCVESEGHLVEVSADGDAFRSRGTFIIWDGQKIYSWHGALSPSIDQKIAQNGAKSILEKLKCPSTPIIEIHEGEEPAEFLSLFKIHNESKWRESYASVKIEQNAHFYPSNYPFKSSQVHLFSFSSLSGSFTPHLIPSPGRKLQSIHSFPILQQDLYSAQQPSLFMIVDGENIWLWQGWRPRGDEENENTATGSGDYRWAAERKAALETALNFSLQLSKKSPSFGLLVHAGLEPPQFKSLFPSWTECNEARECNLEEGKIDNFTISFGAALEAFRERTYSLEELQERPEGLDLLKLEQYLCDEDFKSLLKMEREEFNKLQQWKKAELKKQVGLF